MKRSFHKPVGFSDEDPSRQYSSMKVDLQISISFLYQMPDRVYTLARPCAQAPCSMYSPAGIAAMMAWPNFPNLYPLADSPNEKMSQPRQIWQGAPRSQDSPAGLAPRETVHQSSKNTKLTQGLSFGQGSWSFLITARPASLVTPGCTETQQQQRQPRPSEVHDCWFRGADLDGKHLASTLASGNAEQAMRPQTRGPNSCKRPSHAFQLRPHLAQPNECRSLPEPTFSP